MSIEVSDSSFDTTNNGISIIHLQENNANLQNENIKLNEKLKALQFQFDSLTQVSDQIDQIHVENSELTKVNREIRAELDDAKQRLQITLQKNKELESMLESEKESKSKVLRNETDDLRKQIESDQKSFREKEKELIKQNEILNNQLKSVTDEKEGILKKIDELLLAMSQIFKRKFYSQDEVIEYLSKHSIPVNSLPDNDIQKTLNDAQSENKKLKLQVKEGKKLAKHLEELANEAREEMSQLKTKFETETNTLSMVISNLRQEADLKDIRHKQEIETLEMQLKGAREIIDKLREKQTKQTVHFDKTSPAEADLASLKAQLKASNDKLIDANSIIPALRRQVTDLSAQLNTIQSSKEQLHKVISNLRQENDKLVFDNENLKKEIRGSNFEITELQEQVKSALSQVQAAKVTYKQSKAAFVEEEGKIEKLTSSLSLLGNLLESQKTEIKSLYSDRVKIMAIITKQNAIIQNLEASVIEYRGSIKELNAKCNQLNNAFLTTTESKTTEVEIPVTSWFIQEFSKELCESISDIAQNKSLPVTTKLRSVLSIVTKHYQRIIDQQKEDFNRDRVKMQNDISILSNFVTQIAIATELKELTPEAVLMDYSITTTVSNFIGEHVENLLKKTATLDSLLKDLSVLFDALEAKSFDDAIASVNDLNKTIKTLYKQLSEAKSQISNDKHIIKGLEHKIDQMNRFSREHADTKQRQIDSLFDEKEKLCKDILNAKAETVKLKCDNERLIQNHNNERAQLEIEYEKSIDEIRGRYEEEKIQILKALENQESITRELKSALTSLEFEKNQIQRTLEICNRDIDDKARQVSELQQVLDNISSDNKRQSDKAKEEVDTRYQKALDGMREKNDEQRKIIERLSQSLSEGEERSKCLVDLNNQLSNVVKQQEDSIANLKEELNRERKLIETKVKALSLSSEMRYQNLIEEERCRSQEEKRKIYGFFAHQFRQYYDSRKTLEDETFKETVLNVHAEIERLTRQDVSLRRLLGLDKNESPEEAVSRLLLNMFITK